MNGEARALRKKRTRPLFVVGSCLLLSGIVRIAGDVAPALAEAGLPQINALAKGDGGQTSATSGETLYGILRERESELDRLEEDLVARREFVEAAEAELKMGMAALEASRAELEELAAATRADLAETDGAVAADIARLVSVYEAMKPKEAAALFEAMPPEFAAGFLARMRAEQAANILAGLDPDFGYHISALLASRHVRTDTPEELSQ